MKKVLFIAAALFVCTSFSFASDLESESFDVYSLSPLTASALDYAVMPFADSSWSTTDSSNLQAIKDSLTRNTTGTVLGRLSDIYEKLFYIKESTDYMPNMNTQLNHIADILGYGDSVSAYPSVYSLLYQIKDQFAHSTSLLNSISLKSDSLYTVFDNSFGPSSAYPVRIGPALSHTVPWVESWASINQNLTIDGYAPWDDSRYTLYHYIRNLSDTLATDDDKLLAEAQKENREEIEDSFLNGSSGSTSLGASDFGDLSDVGGTVNDTLSLNGQASVSSFTSGLAGADQEGQNWFSAATRDSLDSVSGGISTFALDDPYNMEGWEDQYSWVLGGE